MKKIAKFFALGLLISSTPNLRADTWYSRDVNSSHLFESETHQEGGERIKKTTETIIKDGLKTTTITEERSKGNRTFVTKHTAKEPVEEKDSQEKNFKKPCKKHRFKKWCHKKYKKHHGSENPWEREEESREKSHDEERDLPTAENQTQQKKLLEARKINLLRQLLGRLGKNQNSETPHLVVTKIDKVASPSKDEKKNPGDMAQNTNSFHETNPQGVEALGHQIMASMHPLFDFRPMGPM